MLVDRFVNRQTISSRANLVQSPSSLNSEGATWGWTDGVARVGACSMYNHLDSGVLRRAINRRAGLASRLSVAVGVAAGGDQAVASGQGGLGYTHAQSTAGAVDEPNVLVRCVGYISALSGDMGRKPWSPIIARCSRRQCGMLCAAVERSPARVRSCDTESRLHIIPRLLLHPYRSQ